MEFQEGNIVEKPAGYGQRLKQSILAWSKKPSVFHGLLTGGLGIPLIGVNHLRAHVSALQVMLILPSLLRKYFSL